MSTSGEIYAAHGFVRVRNLVPADLCSFLTRYLVLLGETGRLEPDAQVPGSGSVHGDPAFDTLLDMARPAVAELIGVDLAPTYSFARLYVTGNELVPHSDRGACEHSVTVHLGGDQDADWPIWVTDRTDRDISIDLQPGDGLCYLGKELTHWRRPFAGRFHAQVFLHYVDPAGPDAALVFDGRPGLGVPRGTVRSAGVDPSA